VTLQAVARYVFIDNSDVANTKSIDIKLGSTTLTLAVGCKGLYETDGTANGLELVFSNDVATSAQYLANTSGKVLTTDKVWASAALVTLTDAGTIAVDMSTFINATVTLGGNRALGNPTNPKVGQGGVIYVVQDGTGTRLLSYGGNYKFEGGTPPVLSTAIGAVDRLVYFVRSSTHIDIDISKGRS
jgi:hypothetical protein